MKNYLEKAIVFIFGGVVLILLLSSSYSVFLRDPIVTSDLEKRSFVTIENVLDKSFFTSEFNGLFEKMLADQFYNRFEWVSLKSQINFSFGNYIYQFTDNPLVLNRIGDSPIYQIGQSDYLTAFPLIYDEVNEERLIRRAEQINLLAKDYPDINVYVYKPTQVTETSFFDEANDIEGAGPTYDAILRANLEVPYDSFEFTSFEDYPRYQYFTDHHWTHRGMYEGYKEIIHLMFGPDEPILEPLAENCHDDLEFFGTYASLSGFATSGAPFCVYQYDLPNYAFYGLDDKVIQNPNDTNKFFESTDVLRDAYHYTVAYDNKQSFITLKSDSEREESIFVVGDSYSPGILPLLAEHFSTVYYLSPVAYRWESWRFFNYDKFLRENDIDTILFMYVVENYFASDEFGDRYLNFDIVRE